jgi:hypothetical protein
VPVPLSLCNLEFNLRKNGKNYSKWVIHLYNGNNPLWLEEYLVKLLEYVNHELGWEQVEEIVVKD